MTFRQLGWRQLAEATEALAAVQIKTWRNMGGEVIAAFQNVNRREVEQQAAAEIAVDPLAKYDRATILLHGIAAWTYPDKLTGEAIASLDEDTALWAALEIVNMGKPPAKEEDEERFFGSPNTLTASAPATATIAMTTYGSPTNGSSA